MGMPKTQCGSSAELAALQMSLTIIKIKIQQDNKYREVRIRDNVSQAQFPALGEL